MLAIFKKHRILMKLVVASCLMFPSTIFAQGSFTLTGTNMGVSNYIKLEWDPSPLSALGGSGKYRYTLYQWDYVAGVWQTTSASYGKIKVLNPFPSVSGDHTKANRLKAWMETDIIQPENLPAGRGKIGVDPVRLADFNANPNGYLKDGSGEYKYDVIFFGTWDRNGAPDQDISAAAATAVRDFLDSGRGVLFGHDTQTSLGGTQTYKNFVSLADKTNLYINKTNDHWAYWRGSNEVMAIRNGYLLEYPWTIEINKPFTVPVSHSTGQFARGIVWMNYPSTNSSWKAAAVDHDPDTKQPGTNNFYLTT